MSVTTEQPPVKTNGHSTLSPSITETLATLRSKIRLYVWVQGIALVLAWLGLAFWISLAIDWLPVPFGNDEPGVVVRFVILLGVAAVGVFLFARYVLRRSVVPLRDRSMAVLLERRFREFDDSLLTAVELTSEPTHASNFNREMLEQTCAQAVDKTGRVQVSEVLNPGPRTLAIVLAIVFLGSVAGFAAAASESFGIWFNRAVLLRDDLWPRTNHISIESPQIIKVARGEDVTIRVIATSEGEKELPSNVRMEFVNEDGVEGSTNLDKHAPRGDTQEFSHTIYGMLSSIKFDVIGGDHRLRDYEIQVVDRPTVQLTLDCEYPEYMRNPDTGEFPFPLQMPASRTVEIPRGTKVTVRAEANKDLQSVTLLADEESPGSQQNIPLNDPGHFSLEISDLNVDQLLRFDLLDTDEITSKEPVRLMIVAMPDEPPTVDARLRGIGTAVTPDVIIPLVGELRDKYGLKLAYWDLVVLKGEEQRAATQVDFGSFRSGRTIQVYDLIAEGVQQREALDIRQLRRDEIQRRNQQGAQPANDNQTSGDDSSDGADSGSGDGDGNGNDGGFVSVPFEPQEASFLTSLQDGDPSQDPDTQGQDGTQSQDNAGQNTSDQEAKDNGQDDIGPVDPTNPFQLVPGETLHLTIVTADACTLDGQPNFGRSQVFALEVVTPQKLRSLLAGRELSLRKRFEDQIVIEFDGSIDLIAGLDFQAIEKAPEVIDSSASSQSLNIFPLASDRLTQRSRVLPILLPLGSGPFLGLLQPDQQQQPQLEPGERPLQLRQKTKEELMLQADADVREVILRSQKNGNEIIGIAEGFEDILLEFTNNRVADSEELTERIQERIATPLRNIGEEMFPELDTRLLHLEENLKNQETREQAAIAVQEYMLEIDDAMQTVLSHMMQLESYEELVEKMREIIEIQQRINRETGTYRRQQIFGGGDDGE